jgi:hypothetical protein
MISILIFIISDCEGFYRTSCSAPVIMDYDDECGHLASPLFPLPYQTPESLDCVWIIRTAFRYVNLTLLHFNISGGNPECEKGRLEIYGEEHMTKDTLLDYYCNEKPPPLEIASDWNIMVISLKVPELLENEGFTGSYRSVGFDSAYKRNEDRIGKFNLVTILYIRRLPQPLPNSGCYWPCRNLCLFDVELATESLSLF